MAEREGFEPSIHLLGVHTISSRAPSASRTSLRKAPPSVGSTSKMPAFCQKPNNPRPLFTAGVHPGTPDETLVVSDSERRSFSFWQGNRWLAQRRTWVPPRGGPTAPGRKKPFPDGNWLCLIVAERVGFEPTCPALHRTTRFRVEPGTATSVPLRNSNRSSPGQKP